MAPLSRLSDSAKLGRFVSFPLDEDDELVSSCRDMRKASRRSIRSLHCSSSCLTASCKAFSVLVRGMCPGTARFAW